MYTVITFTEQEYTEHKSFNNLYSAIGYAIGCKHGANLYGGTLSCYTLPQEEIEMREEQSKAQVNKAMKAIIADKAKQ
jgi:malate synthase